jgi:hypothetical protein
VRGYTAGTGGLWRKAVTDRGRWGQAIGTSGRRGRRAASRRVGAERGWPGFSRVCPPAVLPSDSGEPGSEARPAPCSAHPLPRPRTRAGIHTPRLPRARGRAERLTHAPPPHFAPATTRAPRERTRCPAGRTRGTGRPRGGGARPRGNSVWGKVTYPPHGFQNQSQLVAGHRPGWRRRVQESRGREGGDAGRRGRRERNTAGQLPDGESTVRPREAGFKGSGSCADGSPRPPRAPPTRHRPAPLPEGALHLHLNGFLLALPGRVCVPRACGAWTRSRAARRRPSPRSARTRSPPPPRLPTLGSGTRWNFPGLPAHPPFPGARRASARAPRCGAVRCGLAAVCPSPASPGRKAGC